MTQKNVDHKISSSGKVYVFKSKADPSVKKIPKRKAKASVHNMDPASLKRIKKNIGF